MFLFIWLPSDGYGLESIDRLVLSLKYYPMDADMIFQCILC